YREGFVERLDRLAWKRPPRVEAAIRRGIAPISANISFFVMSSEVETSLIIIRGHFEIASQIVRDSSTTLGMTKGGTAPTRHCAGATAWPSMRATCRGQRPRLQ